MAKKIHVTLTGGAKKQNLTTEWERYLISSGFEISFIFLFFFESKSILEEQS